MKKLLLLPLLFCAVLNAQNSFRIFDSQMNDVTGGTMYLQDTNAVNIQALLTVENIDSVTYQVTAGRLVIQQPAGAANAISWGSIMYVPSADSSALPETMAPAATIPFVGDYFPDTTNGIAIINYCFWDRFSVNNNACVTVTFDNNFASGIAIPVYSTGTSLYPNPAPTVVGVGWNHAFYHTVNLYSSDGALIESRDVRNLSGCEFDLTTLANGIYMISCVGANGEMYSTRFVH
jgi:hypothetical protein